MRRAADGTKEAREILIAQRMPSYWRAALAVEAFKKEIEAVCRTVCDKYGSDLERVVGGKRLGGPARFEWLTAEGTEVGVQIRLADRTMHYLVGWEAIDAKVKTYVSAGITFDSKKAFNAAWEQVGKTGLERFEDTNYIHATEDLEGDSADHIREKLDSVTRRWIGCWENASAVRTKTRASAAST